MKFFLNGRRATSGILQKGPRGWATAAAAGALVLLGGPVAQAQLAQEPFGQVRIQYKKFDWQFYSTQNFNVYFYSGG
ncbi:MAG: hypothetical protein EOO59_06205 [Hymenobacter sp.]|nr:MAG: hypothetical protein EOO59_06205 [Hymenobacter sp.]